MDMFRVASIEKVSVVRAMVQLAAPPGAGRSGDVLASAFGVYFHGSRRVALLGNVGEPSDDGADPLVLNARRRRGPPHATTRRRGVDANVPVDSTLTQASTRTRPMTMMMRKKRRTGPSLRRNRTHRLHNRQRRHYDAQTGRRLIARLANKHPFVRAHLASNSGPRRPYPRR